jgi:cleavage and polyadenylation specificity factor subunit 4
MIEIVDINLDDTIQHNTCGQFFFGFETDLFKKDETEDITASAINPEGASGICKFFLKGSCSKGANCQFRHTRIHSERSIVCKHWLRALCKKGNSCEFLHRYDLSRMPECFFFSKFGECSNPECMYLHVNPEDKIKECPWYARGFCKHGTACRHKHVKKVICDNYFTGFCPLGPNCKFGHPREAKEIEAYENLRKSMVVCHKCGVMGHKASNCPTFPTEDFYKNEKRPIESVTCYKCGQMGHYANKCPNPNLSYQQQQQTHGQNKSYYQSVVHWQKQQFDHVPQFESKVKVEGMDMDLDLT